jgi:hypothetical protein
MRDQEWVPRTSNYNVYNKTNYNSKKLEYLDENDKL